MRKWRWCRWSGFRDTGGVREHGAKWRVGSLEALDVLDCPAGRWARGPWYCGPPSAGSCPYGRQWGGRGRCRGGGHPWFSGQGRQCRPDAASKPAATDKSAESEPMDTTEQKQGCSEEDQRQYLLRMGNAVSSFLEPLGIKVDVDVVGGKDKQGDSGASGSDTAAVVS